jgi:hypothetical protein
MSTVEWHSPANEMAVQQFNIAAAKLNLDANVAVRLRRPDRSLIVSVPIRMDDVFSITTCWAHLKGEFVTIRP